MCLLTENKIPYIADEDIKVYKVLRVDVNGGLMTPYQSIGVASDGIIRASDYSDDSIIESGENRYMVTSGGVHSFKYYEDAYILMDFLNDFPFMGSEHKVFEATIPKGCEFWVSMPGDAFASRELIIGEEVKR